MLPYHGTLETRQYDLPPKDEVSLGREHTLRRARFQRTYLVWFLLGGGGPAG